MSSSITQAMVNMFSANVFQLSQQKGSRLRNHCRIERQKGETDYWDRIGATEYQKKVGRHTQTTYQDTPHSRRAVTMEDFFQADVVDREDQLRIIQNPESEYAQSFAMSLGRGIDDVIIAAGLGTAHAGKKGEQPVPLPDTQILGAIKEDLTTSSGVGNPLTVATLRKVKKLFNQNEAGDYELYFCLSAVQLDDLLGQEKVTSSDYAQVKALVNGDVNTFMGMRFIRSERLPVTSAQTTYDFVSGSTSSVTNSDTYPAGSRICMAWQKMGILLSIGQDIMGRISELPTMHYATQVYYCMSVGATRMEEAKVVAIICRDED